LWCFKKHFVHNNDWNVDSFIRQVTEIHAGVYDSVMRHPLLLVLHDLWFFVTRECWKPLPPRVQNLSLPITHDVQKLQAPSEPVLLPSQASNLVAENDPIAEADTTHAILNTFPGSPTVMYVTEGTVACLRAPQREFDNVLTTLQYGDAVTVTTYHGQYAKVFWSHHEGWVLKDALSTEKSKVWPTVSAGTTYTADDEVTRQIRRIISDTFRAGELLLPLQAGEWIVFHFREMHRTIPWPMTCGRWPGDWQTILRGIVGVHNSISPKTDSIMEWRADDGIGRLAYVERVTPDNTITISVVGYDQVGLFETKELSEVMWRELRPVFIEIL